MNCTLKIFSICLSIVLLLIVCGKNEEQSTAPVVSNQERLPIIDMHMHAYIKLPRSADGTPLPRLNLPLPGKNYPALAKTDDDILRLTLEAMDKYNIVLGVLSYPLENVYKWMAAAPDRFLAGQHFRDPTLVDLEKLREEYIAGRLSIMGEIASQYIGIPPNDPSLEPFYKMAVEFDVPVLIHMEGIAGASSKFRIAAGYPALLEEVLVRHPRLRIYVENAGFPFLEEMIALMYRYPQVYVDLSTISWVIPRKAFYNYLKGLMDAGLEKRLMFGSDQMAWPETIGLAIEAIESADFLTEDQKRDIFYNNAVRFLRLDESTLNQ